MTCATRATIVAVALMLCGPSLARAQDFGVLESGETIDRGNFKARINPMLVFGTNGQDDELGVAALVGYGFTSRFDAEGGVALYDGSVIFGGNGEVAVVKSRPFHLGVIVGFHGRYTGETFDRTGVDLTFLPTAHLTPRFDLTFALDVAFESTRAAFGGGSYRTVHLAPGFEFKLRQDLDFVAELGLGMNDGASHYITAGLAFYSR